MLRACYDHSLQLARAHGLQTIAFPAISTGVYGFPPDRAARIAVATVRSTLDQTSGIERVVFACFDAATLALIQAELG